MQLRGTYHFGETLKNLDVQLSARGHRPGYSELQVWYNAEAQARLRAENGKLPKEWREWQHVENVVSAYWADPSNLRRGFQPPEVDYTGSTHLNLEDGTESLKPRPPRGRRQPRNAAEDGALSPRARVGISAGFVELNDDARFDEGRRDSAAPPPDHAPPFPTNGFWLPPLSRPLTSITHQAADLPLKRETVISGDTSQRRDPQLPPTWSLSPTPLSKVRKQRYTLHPPHDAQAELRNQISKAASKKLSPFAEVKPQDIPQLKQVGALMRKRNYHEAFQGLNDLIDLYPDVARLYTMRATCASKQNGHKVCIRDAKKAMELDETEAEAYCAFQHIDSVFVSAHCRFSLEV